MCLAGMLFLVLWGNASPTAAATAEFGLISHGEITGTDPADKIRITTSGGEPDPIESPKAWSIPTVSPEEANAIRVERLNLISLMSFAAVALWSFI